MKLVKDRIFEAREILRQYSLEDLEAAIRKSMVMVMNANTGTHVPLTWESYVDIQAAISIAEKEPQTIVFPSETIVNFSEMARDGNRIDVLTKLTIPFEHMIVQFDRPVPEEEIFSDIMVFEIQRELGMEKDNLAAILFSRDKHPYNGEILNTVIGFYEPTGAVMRVAWWAKTGLYNNDAGGHKEKINKVILRKMAIAIGMFLTADNVRIERHTPDPVVNRKRIKHGKKPIPEFYTTYIHKVLPEGAEYVKGSGTSHGFMYPVRGHFRMYRSGARAWIPPHFRGLAHSGEAAPKKVYKVTSGESDKINESVGGSTYGLDRQRL